MDKVFDYLVDQWSKRPDDVEVTAAPDIATIAASSNAAEAVTRPPPPRDVAPNEEVGPAWHCSPRYKMLLSLATSYDVI